jgi:hypothetical protein
MTMSSDAVGAPERGGLVVAIMDGGNWSSRFGLAFSELRIHDALAGSRRLLRPTCGPLHQACSAGGISDGRNKVVAQFLEHSRAEWLLMLDPDMTFSPDLAERLIAAHDKSGAPVVGALCFSQVVTGRVENLAVRYRIAPTIYDWVGVEESGERGFRARLNYELDTIQECDGTGAAVLLMHREALRTVVGSLSDVEMGPFDRIVGPGIGPGGGPRIFSEDLSFCIRAGGAGIRIVVDASIRTAHDKGGVWLDQETYLEEAARLDEKFSTSDTRAEGVVCP